MAFNVQENAVVIHEFSKKSTYRGRGDTPFPMHTLPPLGRFAPSLWPPPPLLKNHGYASEYMIEMK